MSSLQGSPQQVAGPGPSCSCSGVASTRVCPAHRLRRPRVNSAVQTPGCCVGDPQAGPGTRALPRGWESVTLQGAVGRGFLQEGLCGLQSTKPHRVIPCTRCPRGRHQPPRVPTRCSRAGPRGAAGHLPLRQLRLQDDLVELLRARQRTPDLTCGGSPLAATGPRLHLPHVPCRGLGQQGSEGGPGSLRREPFPGGVKSSGL